MKTPLRPIPIERVIHPHSIALIGATEDYVKFGGRFTHNLVDHGYKGRFLPINPRRETVLGHKAYPSILELDEAPDMAMVAVPASQLLQTVDECGRAGAGVCVVVTAQLGEFSEEGAELERQAVEIARSYGMRLVGPNCMGMIVPPHGMGLTSSMTLRHTSKLKSGPVAFVSQSGALMGSLFVAATDHGIGLSGMVTVGNQADMELCDFLEGFIDDPQTTTICLYVEAVKSPRRFVELAHRARREGKRILAVKAGQTEAGTAMARSHTASIAGSYQAFATVCEETGILLMDDPDAMMIVANVLAQNPVAGKGGVGMGVGSGGGGAVLVDRLTRAGVPLADWRPETHDKLDRFYGRGHQNNPVDLGAHKGSLDISVFRCAIESCYEDEGAAAYMYMMTPQPLMAETVDILIEMYQRRKKPAFVCFNTSRFGDDIRQKLLDAGVPFVTRADDAIRALDAIFRDRNFADRAAANRSASPKAPASGAVSTSQALRSGLLTEPEVRALLSDYGVSAAEARSVSSPAEAAQAARSLGYPVVMKGVAEGVVHKSDLGLVEIGLGDEAALKSAFERISQALRGTGAGVMQIEVQRMIKGGVELIVGVRNDAAFGPQLMVGSGGADVEIFQDVAFATAPVAPADAERLLRSLKIWPLLDGARGRARIDLGKLCDTIAAISSAAADLGDRLVDLEVNPLKARADGAWAVDGRATLKD